MMKRNVLILLYVLIPVFCFISCSKKSSDSISQSLRIIPAGSAVSGSDTPAVMPGLWVNGTLSFLDIPENASGGEIYDISVYEGVYYSAGIYYVPCPDDPQYDCAQPAFWKNDKIHELPVQSTSGYGCSIIVSQGKVYVAGMDGLSPVLWTDSVPVRLPLSDGAEGGTAYSIIKSDMDLYIGGSVWLNATDGHRPAYWKNGNLNMLGLGDASEGGLRSITISNGKIYTAGWVEKGSIKPVYWLDNNMNYLSDPDDGTIGMVFSLDVYGAKVYAAGFITEENESIFRPVLWNDGTKTLLSRLDETLGGVAWHVEVYGGKAYVSGGTGYADGTDEKRRACMWIDGTRIDLPTSGKKASAGMDSIFIPDSMKGDPVALDDPDLATGFIIESITSQ
ncbi:MAG TPA: hypothetical protein VIS94_11380 [Desulfomonilia bacterium]